MRKKTVYTKLDLWRRIIRAALIALSFIGLFLVALYFRTYAYHYSGFHRENVTPNYLAYERVYQSLVDSSKSKIDKNLSDLSEPERRSLADQQAKKFIQEDPFSFIAMVRKIEEALRSSVYPDRYREYLLEADPYYYYSLTKSIQRTGKIGAIKDGKYMNPYMRAPNGYWTAVTFHPYLGFAWYSLLKSFMPDVTLMKSLTFFPLVTLAFVLLAVVFFARSLRFSWKSTFLGGAVLLLSPIFIQRSSLGWFDTDSYNLFFPIVLLALVFRGVQSKKLAYVYGASAGLVTTLYAFFWTGWPFMLLLLPTSLLVVSFLYKVGRTESKKETIYPLPWVLSYVLSFAVFSNIWIPASTYLAFIQVGWDVLRKFALSEMSLWPNVFLTVGEAQGLNIQKLVTLTAHWGIVALCLLGILMGLKSLFKKEWNIQTFAFLLMTLFSAPLFFMAFSTRRFALLCLMGFVFFSMWASEALFLWTKKVRNQKSFIFRHQRALGHLIFLAVLGIVLPWSAVKAHHIAKTVRPIMDNAWYDSLKSLKEKSPGNSIVHSWWPPGYFIQGIAERSVVVDGGTQHFEEVFWVSRMLMANDERLSLGILRMLQSGGHNAYKYLEALGWKPEDGVDLLLRVVRLNRSDAKSILEKVIEPQQAAELLLLTHGEDGGQRPGYLLVYKDLVEQNLAVSLVANWDLGRAEEMRDKRKGSTKIYGRRSMDDVMQDVLYITKGYWKYQGESPIRKKDGGRLQFENGLVVDLENKDAYVKSESASGRPISLFVMEQGRLQELKFGEYDDKRVDMSVLLFQKNDTLYSLMADRRLIASMLYRLYYLNAEGLQYVKPFVREVDEVSGNDVAIFEVDWKKFIGATENEEVE